jgi:hypothetical protein
MDSPSNATDVKHDEDSSASTQDVNTEESSTSEASTEPLSTFDLVKQAISSEKSEGEEEGDETEGSQSESTNEGAPEGDKKPEDASDESSDDESELTDEEMKLLKPKTRKRIQKLQGLVSEANERVEQFQEKAGRYEQFETFLSTNRISGEEADELFMIGALMKNNPQAALNAITPHYNRLLEITGNIMPDDLKQQVKQGYITEQHARELSQRRANEQVQNAVHQEQQQYQQQQQQVAHQNLINNITASVAKREQQWAANDPDYKMKQSKILERIELKLGRAGREGRLPTTAEGAVQLAEDAKREVEKEIQSYKPKKPVTPPIGGSGSSTNVPEPKNTVELIRQSLGQ